MADKKKSVPETRVEFGVQLTPIGHIVRSAFTSGPGILWLTLFMFVPLLAIVVISFMTRDADGNIVAKLTLENYTRFFGFGELGYDPIYPFIVLRSISLAAGTTILCTVLGLPLAFFIAKLPPRYRNLALVLVMIPFWSNLLIRTYAWQLLLSPDGPITRIVRFFGLVGEYEGLYPSTVAVYIGMVCDYLPYLVLPLYASVEKIDWALAEAAVDLGANRIKMFWFAIVPQIVPGLAAGVTLVLVPATGTFVIPDLLGGAKTVLLGNAIEQQFKQSRDWPFGSAIACFGMLALLLALWVQARYQNDVEGVH
jgi:spermidine/putrescine transport system permease protein